MKAPTIIGVLPGTGWLIEHRESGTVLPLVGWAVLEGGALEPLPLSLGSGWSARPVHPGDETSLRRSALAIRAEGRPPGGIFGPLSGLVDDEATGRLI